MTAGAGARRHCQLYDANVTRYQCVAVFSRAAAAVGAPGPDNVPPGLVVLSSMDSSSGSAMFFLNDLMPLAKSPINPLILLPPPNRTRITASTTNQCQMLKLPITPP